jgi:site-specific DNA recombinase
MNTTKQKGESRSLRLDAYIRVSEVRGREGDSFISPKVQEERIRAWAAATGHEIVAAHHELDVSGGKMDRPKLNEVMRRIDARETEGVVVYRLDRFGRTLIGTLQLIERIHAQGALFASVSDGFDITTETGRLVLRIMLSIAQFELERVSANWRESRTQAVARGIHISGQVPFGYRRADVVNQKTGRRQPAPLEVDPETARYVPEIFRRRAAGQPYSAIRDWLNASGVRTVRGAKWQIPTVQHLLRKRAYLGIASGAYDEGTPNAHPALVDLATWQAAQQGTLLRADRKESPSVLRGLVRCAGCRYTMELQNRYRKDNPDASAASYTCSRARAAGDCPAPASVIAVGENDALGIEDLVIEQMWEHLNEIKFRAVDDSGVDLAVLQERAQEAHARLEETALDVELEQTIGRTNMLKRLAALREAADEAQAALDEALAIAGNPLLDQSVAELREKWESGELTMEEKRAHMAAAIRAVFVRQSPNGRMPLGSRRDYLADRFRIVWATDPAVDVPRQGYRVYEPRPFVFTDANPDDVGVVAL